ncbi:MAG: hypothetical protein A2W23_00865 [Planctomycetes bacterium RBG_16_43_13]|nr:MAG: hypothetical protein A2W23_00865 [Planctomycetes bacterium RBG_16_43_13]
MTILFMSLPFISITTRRAEIRIEAKGECFGGYDKNIIIRFDLSQSIDFSLAGTVWDRRIGGIFKEAD